MNYPRRPFDYAPVEWRKLGEMIGRYDYMIRRRSNREFALDRLREIKTALDSILGGTELPNSGKLDEAIKIKQRSQTVSVEIESLISFSQLQQLEDQGFCRAPEKLRSAIEHFSTAIQAPDATLLLELLSKNPQLEKWYEPWLANRLLNTEGIAWSQLQDVITLTHYAGYSSNPIAASYNDITGQFEEGDKYRRIGVRLLLEQTDPNWAVLSNDYLKESRRAYESAIIEMRILQNGLALRNEILFRLPYYVKLSMPDSQSLAGEYYHRLSRLMDSAQQLKNQTANKTQVGIASKVTKCMEELITDHLEFRSLFLSVSLARIESPSVDDKILINFQAALLTPAFEKEARTKLLLALRNKPRLNAIPNKELKVDETDWNHQGDSLNEFLVYQRQFDLVRRFALLFDSNRKAESSQIEEFEQLFESTFKTLDLNERNPRNRADIDRLNLLAGTILRGYPKDLNRQLKDLQDFSVYSQFRERFDQLDDLLVQRLMLDARDAKIANSIAPMAKIWRSATCFMMLDKQRLQVQADLKNETLAGTDQIRNKLEFVRLSANELPGQPRLPRDPMRELEINCVESLSLANEKSRYLDVEIRYRGNQTQSIWLITEFDKDRLSVTSEAQNPLVNCNELDELSCSTLELGSLVKAIAGQKIADKKRLPPTLVLRPGETKSLRLRVEIRNNTPTANLLMTVTTGKSFIRQKTVIQTPDKSDWELYFTSNLSETSRNESELMVSPIPNSTLDYFLALRNRSGAARKVRLDFQVPQRTVERLPPAGEVNSDQLATYFENVGLPTQLWSISDVEISASENLQPVPLQIEQPENDNDAGQADGSGKKEEVTKDLIRHGIFVTVTDQTNLKSQIWLIRFRPQMPRHYMTVQARYDSVLERIIIDVSRKGLSDFPRDGHNVKCEFADPLVKGTESYLEGQVTKDKSRLRLFAYVPRSNDRVEKVYLHIDGYPRAFVFNIPCGRKSENVEESRNEMRIRIKSPLPYRSFKAPVESIPVEFEVDAPVGAFSDARDRLRLGLDADRDRELVDESSLSWTSDRQATLWIKNMGKYPRIRIENKVDDFKVDLPGAGYRNLKVNLLASLRVGPKTVWSEPNEIWLDSSPPDINAIQPPTGPVAQSEKLVVRVLADDRNMSGVKSIKVGFSEDLPAKLSEKLPLVEAKKQEDNTWLATLPLADIPIGIQTIAASAEDAVGNKSLVKTAKIRVISDVEKEEKAKTFVVNGQVKFNSAPQANVVVEMLSADGTTVSSKTSNDGMFQFKDVPAGRYTIKSRKVVKNNPRLARFTLMLRKGTKPDPVILELE